MRPRACLAHLGSRTSAHPRENGDAEIAIKVVWIPACAATSGTWARGSRNKTRVAAKPRLFARWAPALIALCALLPASQPLGADDYPSRPVKLLVGAPPGGTTDTMARAIAEPMAAALRQPVVVENRPGAGGNLAADAVAKAPPDGYTLLVSFSSHTINATLYAKLPFDPAADFTPITMVATVPSLLVGNPKVPATNLAELIAL